MTVVTLNNKDKTRLSAKPLYIVSDVARISCANDGQIRRWLKGDTSGRGYNKPFLQVPPG